MTELRKPGALLLTPGAGADRNQRTLVALEAAVSPLPCSRVDFPYRLQGRRVPDKPPVAIAHLMQRAATLAQDAGVSPGTLVLGGRSYGGRMCSMAVAQGLPAAGLILLSYPLHPPGKPDKLRTEHLPDLTVPCLFVSGEQDPFGTPAELEAATATIPGAVTHEWLPGGHSPKPSLDDEICALVTAFVRSIRRPTRTTR